jgi:hypothetical protein
LTVRPIFRVMVPINGRDPAADRADDNNHTAARGRRGDTAARSMPSMQQEIPSR